MIWKPALIEALEPLRHWLEPFVPGAIGAAIGQMFEAGLGWRDRLAQWTVGLTFAAFLVPAAGHVFGWGQPLVNAVGFVIGTLAFKAYKPMRDAVIAGGVGGLKTGLSNLGSWVPRRGPAAAPKTTEEEQG